MITKFIAGVSRLILGATFAAFGLDGIMVFFFKLNGIDYQGFVSSNIWDDINAISFTRGLEKTPYWLPVVKIVELVTGLGIASRIFTPLFLVILFPITLNVFLFHLFLEQSRNYLGIILMACHVFLAWYYRGYYSQISVLKTKI